MTSKRENSVYKAIIFALVLLFNPNVNIVDILPDFLAYLIIVKLLEKPANTAPHFEEARIAFKRLALVTLIKLPAFLLVIYIRRGNTLDNDVYAMTTLIFAVLELTLLFPAINNTFEALFHLGERTDAQAPILPFPISKDGKKTFAPEMLRSFSFMFVICKALLFVLPELFILSTTTDSGVSVSPISRYYPYALICAQIIGYTIGGVWLYRSVKYAKSIYEERKLATALEFMQTDSGRESYEKRIKLKELKSSVSLLAVASFFSLELVFTDFQQINLLPHFIYGSLLLFAMHRITKHTQKSNGLYVCASAYILLSVFTYVFTVIFMTKYDYTDLIDKAEAVSAYTPILWFSALELIALLALLFFSVKATNNFILEHTGLLPSSKRYSKTEKDYHNSLIKKSYILFSIAALSGMTKCVNVFLNREMSIMFSDITDVTKPTFAASPLPWFGLVVTAVAIAYIIYSLLLTSTLKDELEMKYQE